MTATIQTTARNAGLGDFVQLLQAQRSRMHDVVVSADKLTSVEGLLRVKGAEAVLNEDGVTTVDGVYRPTEVFDEGVSDKLNIPLAYVRRMRCDRPDLYDANVNGLLGGRKAKVLVPRPGSDEEPKILREAIPGDQRNFLVRLFKGDDGGEGIARALLSSKFARYDNLDVLLAALEGIKQAGVAVDIDGCDLSERRMIVKVRAPEIQAMAPELLKGYKSPYGGAEGTDNPTVFAGFVLTNSETGGGAFTIVPRLIVQICTNGMQMTRDASRVVHLGSKMEEGIIEWSHATEKKNVELITLKATDAVSTFLSSDYLTGAIDRLEEAAGKPLRKAVEVIKNVTKQLAFTDLQAASILDFFVQGGQNTAGGVLQAVTAASQSFEDPDVAHDMESKGVKAMELAAAL